MVAEAVAPMAAAVLTVADTGNRANLVSVMKRELPAEAGTPSQSFLPLNL